MSLRSTVLMATIAILFLTSTIEAQNCQSTIPVRLLLPKSVKAGTPLVLAAKPFSKTNLPKTIAFQNSAFGCDPIIAQLDRDSGHYWFVATATEAISDREITAAPIQSCEILRIVDTDGTLRFLDGDRETLRYQRAPKSEDGKYTRANYVHPVFGFDGEVLTQDFPSDHRHHRGVFWAWHQLWVGEQRAGDSWDTSNYLTIVKSANVVDQGPVFATLKIDAEWTSTELTDNDGKPKPFVHETTTIRLFRATDTNQAVDFRIEMKPLFPNVKIGGAENIKEYSGFTVRVRPPKEMRISTTDGKLPEDGRGVRTPWTDVSGRFHEENSVSGIAILSHKTLPEFPPRWLLRYYGMQNLIYPGRHPLALSPSRPLVLRHRLLIHRGDTQAAHVAAQQTNYEMSP